MCNEITVEQSREHALNRILMFAKDQGLDGDAIALIFETGIAPAQQLRPDIFPSDGTAQGFAKRTGANRHAAPTAG